MYADDLSHFSFKLLDVNVLSLKKIEGNLPVYGKFPSKIVLCFRLRKFFDSARRAAHAYANRKIYSAFASAASAAGASAAGAVVSSAAAGTAAFLAPPARRVRLAAAPVFLAVPAFWV